MSKNEYNKIVDTGPTGFNDFSLEQEMIDTLQLRPAMTRKSS